MRVLLKLIIWIAGLCLMLWINWLAFMADTMLGGWVTIALIAGFLALCSFLSKMVDKKYSKPDGQKPTESSQVESSANAAEQIYSDPVDLEPEPAPELEPIIVDNTKLKPYAQSADTPKVWSWREHPVLFEITLTLAVAAVIAVVCLLIIAF